MATNAEWQKVAQRPTRLVKADNATFFANRIARGRFKEMDKPGGVDRVAHG